MFVFVKDATIEEVLTPWPVEDGYRTVVIVEKCEDGFLIGLSESDPFDRMAQQEWDFDNQEIPDADPGKDIFAGG
jgi:hypothetical protein